jgi:hypothetical protein
VNQEVELFGSHNSQKSRGIYTGVPVTEPVDAMVLATPPISSNLAM